MKRVAAIIVMCVSLVLLALICLPLLLSSDYVKTRVEQKLAELTGRTVILNGDSSLSFSPYLGVTYGNVTILGEKDSEVPLMTADELGARLSLLSAIWGEAQIADLELTRPRFNLVVDENGARNWIKPDGPLLRRFNVPAGSLPAYHLGTLTFREGIVSYTDMETGSAVEISSVSGEIEWADTNSVFTMNSEGIWNGERVSLYAIFDDLEGLLRGGRSVVSIALNTNPGSLEYSGSLINTGDVSLDGELTFASSAPHRLAEWLNRRLPIASVLGAIRLSGRAVGPLHMVRFEDASLTLADQSATGQLQITDTEDRILSLNGTLAFDTLRLPDLGMPFLQDSRPDAEDMVWKLSLFEGLRADLRISANSATSGSVEITELAASLTASQKGFRFEVGHSRALGGRITGSVSFGEADADDIELVANLSQIQLERLFAPISDSTLTISGEGNGRISLLRSEQVQPPTLTGSMKMKSPSGTLNGFSLETLLESGTIANPASSDTIMLGSTSYTDLEIDARLEGRNIIVDAGKFLSDGGKVVAAGRANAQAGTLALRGMASKGEEGSEAVTFFVGGTPQAPLFVVTPGNGLPPVAPQSQ